MSGLSNSTRKTYVQTFGNFFVKKSVKENPEAVRRVNKIGNEVYELRYDTLEGSIIDFDLVKHEIEVGGRMIKSERLEISLLCGDESVILTMMSTSSHAYNFYKRMEAINYHEAVTFQMWAYDNPFLAVMQFGGLIVSKYQKDDVPAWKELEVNGEKVYDKTDSINFFRPKVADCKKQIALYGDTAKKVEKALNFMYNKDEKAVNIDVKDVEDDLPF